MLWKTFSSPLHRQGISVICVLLSPPLQVSSSAETKAIPSIHVFPNLLSCTLLIFSFSLFCFLLLSKNSPINNILLIYPAISCQKREKTFHMHKTLCPTNTSSESQCALKAFATFYCCSAWTRQPEEQQWQGLSARAAFAKPRFKGQKQVGTSSATVTGTLMTVTGLSTEGLLQISVPPGVCTVGQRWFLGTSV